MLEDEMRDVVDSSGKDLCMGRKRPTDMVNNREVKMPGPGPPRVEAEFSTRLSSWQRAFMSFKETDCNPDGVQKRSNLSPTQLIAVKTLSKKVAKVEIIVLQADKGSKFVVVDEETYLTMAQDHVCKDKKTSPKEIAESQRILSSTGKALGNILGLGRSHSDSAYGRCMDNLGSEAEDVPTLKVFPKIHKDPDPRGHPQSRPVVTASSGLTARAGDCLADFLEPLVSMESPRVEDKSTEEVLSQLLEAEVEIREQGLTESMVGSLDVRALYPSLDHEGTAAMVATFVEESEVNIQGVDWRAAQVFIASNMTRKEVVKQGLKKIIPRRLKRKGPRPGPTTSELWAKRPNPEISKDASGNPEASNIPIHPTKWMETNTDILTVAQKKKILGHVARIAVLNIFKNHHYQFAGQTYRQLIGAPIGLRLTSVISRIVMDRWFKIFLQRITKAMIQVHAAMKYIDDINLVMTRLCLGSRWRGDTVVHSEEWEEEDRVQQKSMELVTMECVRDAASSVIPWLDFTFDLPELHDSGKVPMLDLQVWVHHPVENKDGLESDTLCWEFFEKPCASQRVLRASSAYTWRSKLVTMSMEVFRRLRNTSRQLSLEAKNNILSTFVKKMRMSGYSCRTVDGILESGLQHYYRKLKIDLTGGPALNRREDNDAIGSRRMKMSAKHNWFRKRGGVAAREEKGPRMEEKTV